MSFNYFDSFLYCLSSYQAFRSPPTRAADKEFAPSSLVGDLASVTNTVKTLAEDLGQLREVRSSADWVVGVIVVNICILYIIGFVGLILHAGYKWGVSSSGRRSSDTRPVHRPVQWDPPYKSRVAITDVNRSEY